MPKKLLKARDVERLENTSTITLLPLGDMGQGPNAHWPPCVVTCNEGMCTGTAACLLDACTATCGNTCNEGDCTGTYCEDCLVTCVP